MAPKGPQPKWRDDAVLVDPVERAKAGPLSDPSPLATVWSGVVQGVGGMVATATTPFAPDVAAEKNLLMIKSVCIA